MFAAKQINIRKEKLLVGGGIECLGSDGKRNKKTRVCEVEIINGEPKEKFGVKTREHIVYTSELSLVGNTCVILSFQRGLGEILLMTL